MCIHRTLESGVGPLCHVTAHIVQTEVIRTELRYAHRGRTRIIVIGTTVGLEVRKETTLGVTCL